MNEEEKKAIERLEEQLNFWKKQNIKNSDCEIILNLITKLQKENEHWKNGFEGELQDNRKNTCELLKQDLIIREKDKQIDLMADFMYKTGTGRKALSCVFRQNDECNENGCEYCIKRYFAGLLEKE